MNFEEYWLGVDDFPRYMVSNQGRVKNRETDRILRPQLAGKGYLQLRLCDDSGCYMWRINRLVASVFIRPIADREEVDHIDGDKTNNFVGNLEIVSHRENILRSYRTGLRIPRKQAIRCIETKAIFSSVTEAAQANGVRQGTMSNHLAGRLASVRSLHFEVV